MNSKLKHLHAVLRVVHLRLLGLFCSLCFIGMSYSLNSQTSPGPYRCLLISNFQEAGLYTANSDDCDGTPGTFGVQGGRFTVNDAEGLTCIGSSGGADNELRLATQDISEYRNITLTFEYTIKDDSDGGFECSSVFGNGDDLIFMDFTVNGNTTRVNIFCEDTAGPIEQSKRVQVAIPDGDNLDVTIYAGTQAPSEFFYFDRLLICGNEIDKDNPPDDPTPPDPVGGETFPLNTKAAKCISSDDNLIPSLMSSIYASFNTGMWYDSEDNLVNEIVPSSAKLFVGENLFRYILPDGNVSVFTLTIVNNELANASFGPFCSAGGNLNLPAEINQLSGGWQMVDFPISNTGEFSLGDLQVGGQNEVVFTPDGAGCNIFFNVEAIEQFEEVNIESCPPGVVNLLDSFPDLTRVVEELSFEYLDRGTPVLDPQNVDLSILPTTSNVFSFIQEIPTDIGCRVRNVGVVFDGANCPVQGDALSATISIDPANGNICEGECGMISVDIVGGTPPYELKFEVDIPIRVPIFNIPLPVIPFPYINVSGDEYSANICSANIDEGDFFSQNDILYNSTTNTWQIPTFITVQGIIRGQVRDSDGTEVNFTNEIEMQAFDKPDPPIDETDIVVCSDELNSYADLQTIDNFAEIEWYDGDPSTGINTISDFSNIDLVRLYGVWTNPNGCRSDPFEVEYTERSVADCSTTCTTAPDMPQFVGGNTNMVICDDGSFQGFTVDADPLLNLEYNWYGSDDVLVLANNVNFSPDANVQGDFYVIAIDGDCPFSPKLEFSVSFYQPTITTESCQRDGTDAVVDISLSAGETIAAISPVISNANIGGDSYRLFGLTVDTDYTITIRRADGCTVDQTYSIALADCPESCGTAGNDNLTGNEIDLTGGSPVTVDLNDYLTDASPGGVFEDFSGNPVANPYDFTGDVTIVYRIPSTATCPEDMAEIRLTAKSAAKIDGTVCNDNVFCDEIEIVLSGGTGAGAPYSLKFRMFDAAVIDDIIFTQDDLLNDSTLVVTVCVQGNRTEYINKRLIIAEGQDAGNIKIEDLTDGAGNLLGQVPPIEIEFSELPVVNQLNTQDICSLDAGAYPINDLNSQILTSGADTIEWWYDQPSDPNTPISSRATIPDLPINPNDKIWALVISPESCKVEIPIDFTVINNETVEVTYQPIYCLGDPIIPAIVPTGVDIDFDYSPRNGSSSIVRSTGELRDPVVGTEYIISWTTSGQCPAKGEYRINVVGTGDPLCNCTALERVIISGTNRPPQPPLQGDGISYCFGEDVPMLTVSNNPGNYTAIWYDSRAATNEVFRGDVFANPTREVNYYVTFEDANGCQSDDFTATWVIRQQAQLLTTRPISLCADEESSIDLNSFLVNANDFIVDWVDPSGNAVADPANYTAADLDVNVHYTNFVQNYTDPDGCTDEENVQFIKTSYDDFVFSNFVCNAAENFYTLSFEAASHFNVTTDPEVGKVSESLGVWLIDSVAIGTDINIVITNIFEQCNYTETISAPSCDCDALPDPRTVNRVDTICYDDAFEIFNSNNDYIVNWYTTLSGGISISNDVIFNPQDAGTYYVEIIDKLTNCVSERKPLFKEENIPSPDRNLFVRSNIITCEELQDSFRISNVPAEFTVEWLDATTNAVVHVGETFRPNSNDYPVGDYEFIAVYRRDNKCSGGTGHRLSYRLYSRPNFNRMDTICSEDLKTVDFEFITRGIVLEPTPVTPLGGELFRIEDIPIGDVVDIKIGRDQTGVICEIFRDFTATSEICPCPEITQPEARVSNFKTVCNNVTDANLEVLDPNNVDVAANWYDDEDAAGTPLLENSLTFVPPDSGAYFVQFLDTITGCTSIPTQMNLFYDDVPDAGLGVDRTVCGIDSIALDTLLMQPITAGGFWNDPNGQAVGDKIRLSDYSAGGPLEFQYIVVANNSQMCSDTMRAMLTIQPPFNAGVSQDLNPICDQAGVDIDFAAQIGSTDVGSWLINDGIDLNLDPVLNSNQLSPGDHEFTYVVQADAVCPPQTSYVRVIILDLPEVGVDTPDTICSGTEFGYSFASALDGNPDFDGVWEDVDGALGGIDINDNPGQVDLSSLPAGDYIFRYGKASGSCDNSAELMLHVLDNNRAGLDTLFQICSTANLEVNFTNILPNVTEYDLSIDGAFTVDFSVPENVDLGGLPSGEYFIRNTANSVSACTPDESVVTLVIEASKPSPNIEGMSYDLCYGDTVDLSDFLMVDGGVFNEFAVSGALDGDSLYTARLPEGSTHDLVYEILPDSVCASQQNLFMINLETPPNAQGVVLDGSVCQGDSIDLQSLLGANTDAGGIFEDIEMTGGLEGSVLTTDMLGESSPLFSYSVGDGVICPVDVALFNVAILDTPELMDMLDLQVCLGGGSSLDLTSELSQRSIDVSGEWLDEDGIGIDLSDPMAVDVSSLTTLTKYNIKYALSNGMCADTMDVVFELDNTLSAGDVVYPGGSGFLGHCEGDLLELDLNDLLENEDQGSWFDENGVLINTSDNYDFGQLTAGSYSYRYVVRNTDLLVCEDDSVTIQILVEPAPNAGEDKGKILCESQQEYDLLDLLDAQIDASGRFNDVNNIGNLSGSIINTSVLTPGMYEYEYVLATNTSCDPDVAVLTIEMVTNISAGDDNRDEVCQGDIYDLNNLILNGDPDGRFEEIATSSLIVGDLVTTSTFPSGELNVWYIVESESCESDTAVVVLDIIVTPDLGADISDLVFCQSAAGEIDLNTLLNGRDQSGEWLDPTNLGLDLSDYASVDITGIEPLVPSTLRYTVSNGDCADTINVSFTIDPLLIAGEDIAPYEHCEGRSEILDLYEDLFAFPVDQGVWTIDGAAIPDAQDYDLKDLEAGDYTLTHTVNNTNLGVCPAAVQNVTLIVHPAVSAGDDTQQTLCQIPTAYNLLDYIDTAADATGMFEAVDNAAGLTGTDLLTTDLTEGTYDYLYIVPGSANCESDSAVLSITIVSELDAGLNGSDMVCQGDDFDLRQFVIDGGGDPGGLFTNMNTGQSYIYDNSEVMTDNLSGTQVIRYLIESANCDPDEAEFMLEINPSYDTVTEINIAEGDSAFIDGAWRFEAETFVIPGNTALGCDSTVTTVLTISDVKVDVAGVSCIGLDDGMISVTVSAGVGPFNIQITQNTGGNGSIGGSLTSFGTLDFDFFTEGEYTVLVAETTSGDTIFNENVIVGVNNQVTPTIAAVDASCYGENDGSLTVTELTIEGVQQNLGAYDYEWSSGDFTSATGKLNGGIYQLVIIDTVSMCPFTFEAFVGEPEPLLVDTIINPFQCGGTKGSIELDLLSSVEDIPEFSLNGGPIQGVGFFSELDAGLYDVTIDYGECSQTFEDLEVLEATDNIIEIEPNDITLISDQEEEINVLINFEAIDVEWSSDLGLDTTNQLNPIITATETMDYVITVTDGFGCTVTDTLKVEVIEWQDPIPDIFIPNVFNPLATGTNSRFAPQVEENYEGTYEMQIFNRWGNVVYDNIQGVYDPNAGWDGMYGGRVAEIGVYTYVIQFRFDNGTYLRRVGDLTLVY